MSRTWVPIELRHRIAQQAQHRCGYCQTAEDIVGAPMDIEHLLPVALGGKTEEENLWLACSLCNGYKGMRIDAVDPLTGQMTAISILDTKSGQSTMLGSTTGRRSSV